ncbi:hypothetical protein DLH72_01940 [Candidatus Gracilibacteria bacterium]|nr:MAG: hypothetical protein DLH72_01940 [Candidatus Gracilibacteria bacterium]
MKNFKKAFTLIEIMVSILIIVSVLIIGFQLYSLATASKIKLIEQTNLEKNIFYFSEKLFTLVKKGGTLDYEEYFNRKVINSKFTNQSDAIESGHFKEKTGFGNFGADGIIGTDNFGKGFYYCLSGDGEVNKLGINGCWNNDKNTDSNAIGGSSRNYSGVAQRYGEYSFQFIDYNSNYDNDGGNIGDENSDGKIIRDDDDQHKGIGPEVFDFGTDVKELYLLSGNKRERTYIRWNYFQDEYVKDPNKNCSSDFEYCRGTVEYLKLEGKDWGIDHIEGNNSEYENDGVIDTWVISKDFSGGETVIAGGSKDSGNFWKPIFSDDINISDFKVYAYPNIDNSKVWNTEVEDENGVITDKQQQYLLSPYITISIKVKPSHKVKTKIKGNIKEVGFNTTINLTDIFSN